MDNTAIMPERLLTQLDAEVLVERYAGEPDWLSDARGTAVEQVQRLGHCIPHRAGGGERDVGAVFPGGVDRGGEVGHGCS